MKKQNGIVYASPSGEVRRMPEQWGMGVCVAAERLVVAFSRILGTETAIEVQEMPTPTGKSDGWRLERLLHQTVTFLGALTAPSNVLVGERDPALRYGTGVVCAACSMAFNAVNATPVDLRETAMAEESDEDAARGLAVAARMSLERHLAKAAMN